ncbi:inositol 1,4,5-trisphosphate receptor-interacting protein-like 1 [Dryobates pubescens]|uniref:inositol 1,4,5-trisphosphate receptor-interacting protein-like 1 n=1 Tax=Dryobates pubescens TaxID=118200 RepID=UPI0023B9F422|nr:inositol 1,4,5-trisphosphate receptor-interacting protein-like 1 [Dryobates pubescens]
MLDLPRTYHSPEAQEDANCQRKSILGYSKKLDDSTNSLLSSSQESKRMGSHDELIAGKQLPDLLAQGTKWENAMAAMVVVHGLSSVLQSLILGAKKVGYELDEYTKEHMKQREEMLSRKMAHLLREVEELEQRSQQQGSVAWTTMLLAALQQWQFWAIAGFLLLLLVLCWRLKKWSREPASSREKEHCGSYPEPGQEEEELEEEEEELQKEEVDGEDPDEVKHTDRLLAKHIHWPVQELSCRSWLVKELVEEVIQVYQELSSDTHFPVMQPPIGIGSTYEGWSHHGDDAVYRLLVPLKAGRGHSFCLKESIEEQRPKRTFRAKVQLKCTCTTEEPAENMPCFLHHPDKRQRRHRWEHLLSVLCTSSYLDVHKIVAWFQDFVRSIWGVRPKMCHYHLKMLPSPRSCKLQLTDSLGRTFVTELIFGLQQGDSDIFLCSRSREATLTTSTTWSASCAVAEAKSFQHVARQVPRGSYHLKCLRVCTQILAGTGFSSAAMKALVMHLLTTTPLSGWCRGAFVERLKDIMQYLHCCLERKHLHHFFLGNDNVPEEISLPAAYEMAEPLNLFQGLAQNPACSGCRGCHTRLGIRS